MLKKVRQFLTPGWVLTAIVAIAFSYVAFTVLAPWQLGKNTATQHRNEQLRHAFEVDPVEASELMSPGTPLRDGDEWRRVTAHGEFVPNTEVLLRNRPVSGAPAIQVLNVFKADNGESYVVNRGFVRPSGTSIPTIATVPEGKVTISAYARKDELTPVTDPIVEDRLQVYGINTEQIAGLLKDRLQSGTAAAQAGGAASENSAAGELELHQDWLQLDENSPGVIEAIPLPQLESGPYLSYGIQWIFFGLMAPAAVVWFVIAEIRERRRDREEQAAHEAELAAGAGRASSDEEKGTETTSTFAPKTQFNKATGSDDTNRNGQTGQGNEPGQGGGSDKRGGSGKRGEAGQRPGSGKRGGSGEHAEPKNLDSNPTSDRPESTSESADEIRAHRLAQRYGDSGHRFGGKSRDDRYDERF